MEAIIAASVTPPSNSLLSLANKCVCTHHQVGLPWVKHGGEAMTPIARKPGFFTYLLVPKGISGAKSKRMSVS